MQILQTIVSYFAIASAFLSSLFSWGNAEMIPFKNDYDIPESIPEYTVISTEEKTDWTAKWIWSSENPSEKNVWMCFNKKLSLDEVPGELVAHISADSKYWLYINGENVVFEGNVSVVLIKTAATTTVLILHPISQRGKIQSVPWCGTGITKRAIPIAEAVRAAFCLKP